MASTAPDLTWAQTANQNPTSSTSISDIISAINSVVTASTWTIKASAADYLLIAPPAASAIPNMRILIAGDATGPNSANMAAPHTTQANTVYVALAPDSGKDALTNAWNSALNPFDTDRWTEFLKTNNETTAIATDSIYAVYSSEVFALFFRTASGDDYRGFIAGAIIDPPFDADGEGTPGRIYGIATNGEAQISTTFLGNSGEFLGSGTGQNVRTIVFDPVTPTSVIDVDKVAVTGPLGPRMTTANGNIIMPPVVAFMEDSPNNLLGTYRQIGWWQDARARQIVQDSVPTTKGIIFAPQDLGDCDSIIFYNKP